MTHLHPMRYQGKSTVLFIEVLGLLFGLCQVLNEKLLNEWILNAKEFSFKIRIHRKRLCFLDHC